MKIKPLLISITTWLLLTGCSNSVKSKANDAFTKVVNKVFNGKEMSVVDKEFTYIAPNDSLAIIHLIGKVKGYGSADMYFGYVVKDNQDNDYWVVSFVDPKQAVSKLIDIEDISNDSLTDKGEYNLLLSFYETEFKNGHGKTMKETEELLKENH